MMTTTMTTTMTMPHRHRRCFLLLPALLLLLLLLLLPRSPRQSAATKAKAIGSCSGICRGRCWWLGARWTCACTACWGRGRRYPGYSATETRPWCAALRNRFTNHRRCANRVVRIRALPAAQAATTAAEGTEAEEEAAEGRARPGGHVRPRADAEMRTRNVHLTASDEYHHSVAYPMRFIRTAAAEADHHHHHDVVVVGGGGGMAGTRRAVAAPAAGTTVGGTGEAAAGGSPLRPEERVVTPALWNRILLKVGRAFDAAIYAAAAHVARESRSEGASSSSSFAPTGLCGGGSGDDDGGACSGDAMHRSLAAPCRYKIYGVDVLLAWSDDDHGKGGDKQGEEGNDPGEEHGAAGGGKKEGVDPPPPEVYVLEVNQMPAVGKNSTHLREIGATKAQFANEAAAMLNGFLGDRAVVERMEEMSQLEEEHRRFDAALVRSARDGRGRRGAAPSHQGGDTSFEEAGQAPEAEARKLLPEDATAPILDRFLWAARAVVAPASGGPRHVTPDPLAAREVLRELALATLEFDRRGNFSFVPLQSGRAPPSARSRRQRQRQRHRARGGGGGGRGKNRAPLVAWTMVAMTQCRRFGVRQATRSSSGRRSRKDSCRGSGSVRRRRAARQQRQGRAGAGHAGATVEEEEDDEMMELGIDILWDEEEFAEI